MDLRATVHTMRGAYSIGLPVLSNVFMTPAWCGHLKFCEWHWAIRLGPFSVVLINWGIAFFEYCLQVPADRMGHLDRGGSFSLVQLKVIQEVATLVVFTVHDDRLTQRAAALDPRPGRRAAGGGGTVGFPQTTC